MNKKVFVSGCYYLLHSGHVEFFQQASQSGDLYVGIGSDATYQRVQASPTNVPSRGTPVYGEECQGCKGCLYQPGQRCA